MSSFLFICFKT